MYRSIMVPLDGFATAERALRVAARLARASGAQLHLVHGLDLLVFPPYVGNDPTPEWWSGRAVELAQDYLDKIAARVRIESGREVSTAVLQEPIAPSLLEHAGKVEADLIVTTTHGRSPVSRFWLGSVADQLARSAFCPTLFLRAAEVVPETRATDPFRHILVPLDGSTLAEGVLPVALELVRVERANLTLLNVHNPQMVALPSMAGPFSPELPMTYIDPGPAQQEARDYLEMIAVSIEEPGIEARQEVVLTSGSAATEILEFARANSVDLIAMSTRGQGGARRLLLGSVADKVLRAATVPVLLFRPDDDA